MAISAARIVAVKRVALTNVVVRALPLKRTTESLLRFTKFVPLTVKVKLDPPAVALLGERVVIVGTGTGETVKLTAFEVPPPGAGVFTVMGKFPTAVMSETRICAVTFVALTNAVVRAAPLNQTTELLLKFVPLTVNVNAGSPAILLVGDNVVTVGTGLFTAKLSAGVDAPPPGVGFVTLTRIVLAAAISEAAIEAVSCPELTMVAV
jgi:hypothetical protein